MKPICGFEYLQNPKTRKYTIQKLSKNLEPMAKVFFFIFIYFKNPKSKVFYFEKLKKPKTKFKKSKDYAM